MIIQSLILAFGLILLYAGSSLLVEGAASTAIMLAVRPVIVGLTVVSLATSAPELLVSLIAAFKGSGGISLGNILGSNVINIALVLGVSAVIKPVFIQKRIIKTELPYMIFISLVFWLLCVDGLINHVDGIILLSLLLVFLVYGIATAKENGGRDTREPINTSSILKNTGFILAGIVMLAFGAKFVVQEAIVIAESFGLSQTFIGISVVALGTSLPELATSAVAAAKGESDISVGNVVGSNLFNICLVMGVVGILNPMKIENSLHFFQFPFMVCLSIALGVIALIKQRISKRTGFGFITLFVVYILVSYSN